MKIFLVLLLLSSISMSQHFGIWKNYSDMKNVKDVDISNGTIWAATSGGIFSYADNEFRDELRKSEGLSSQNITSVAIDPFNRIWLGTVEGIINVYDPSDGSVKKILDINRTEYTQKAINDILINNSAAFISTDFGLSIIDIDEFTFEETVIKFGSFPSASRVHSVFVSDLIFVSTENGFAFQKGSTVNLSNPDVWETFGLGNIPGSITASDIYCSIIYNSTYLVGTDKGLFIKNGSNWNNFLSRKNKVNRIMQINQQLYVLYENELVRYNGTDEKSLYSATDNILASFIIDDRSDSELIYIASANGIIILQNDAEESLIPNGPVINSFISLAVDEDHNLWAATGRDSFGKGFMKFDQAGWTNYNISNNSQLPSNAYHKVFSYNNIVYLCTWGSGFSTLNNDVLTNYNGSNTPLVGITGSTGFIVVQDIKIDDEGNTWIFNHWPFNNEGLVVLTSDNNAYSYRFPFFTITEDFYIENGAIDNFGTKWFNIKGRGLYYFNENRTFETTTDDLWGRLNLAEYFDSQEITSLVVDKRNEIWVGTSLGVKIITDPSRPTSQLFPSFPLRQQSINCIAVDPLNQKWLGTNQGLFHVTSDGSALINQYDSKNSPLPVDDIKSIAIDDKSGLIYVGTDFGLSVLQTNSIEPNDDFSELYTYPNPFIIDGSQNNLKIDGLIENSSIKILSLSGDLINEFETIGGKIDFWNGRDLNGNFVSSGIYLIVAFDEEANNIKTTKVAVLRK
ncbi:MAG: hypothetical protein JW995_14010 [Melioribacteraceae bacterium]|nr:hypothetical protein [Melioribacteraceae bacterium]